MKSAKSSSATTNKKRKLNEVSNSGASTDKAHQLHPSSKGGEASNLKGKSAIANKKIKSENRAREDSIERDQELELGHAKSARRAKESDPDQIDASGDLIKGSMYSLFRKPPSTLTLYRTRREGPTATQERHRCTRSGEELHPRVCG